IEKAHPDVFNTLLQILEDGRLTDSHGRTADFRNAVIILTSNLGSGASTHAPIGFTARSRDDSERESRRRNVEDALKQAFRPEFLNRIDEIIVFEPLTQTELALVADLLLAEVRERLEERNVHFEVTEAARAALVQEGYDPTYGARPLRRTIQRRVENPLAKRVLAGDFAPGDRLRVDITPEGDYTFERIDGADRVAV
ncbi:MAG: AAA family ATPase, partial [Acidobacteria bacterium]|nr:AAA family ATPase [Acidobacteriota bacterium]